MLPSTIPQRQIDQTAHRRGPTAPDVNRNEPTIGCVHLQLIPILARAGRVRAMRGFRPAEVEAEMWDRYDVRDSHRDRDDECDRSFGGRGGRSERERNEERDPREVFTRDLDLPQGRDRRPVRERDRVYEIDGTESRMRATVGAFRVVAESDLHDGPDDTRKAQRHLEREGLMRTSALSSDDRAVSLTDSGRDLLEANRHERHERSCEPRQAFYAGLRRPRELTHDSKVYPAYSRAEERLREQ